MAFGMALTVAKNNWGQKSEQLGSVAVVKRHTTDVPTALNVSPHEEWGFVKKTGRLTINMKF